MATTSPHSSPSNSRHAGSFHTAAGGDHNNDNDPDPSPSASFSVPAEALVEHLLAAKRALSSMTLLMRANALSTHARQLHEDSVVLSAQTAFLRKAIASEGRLLKRIQENLVATFDASAKELRAMLKALDEAYIKLQETINVLRGTVVDPVFRPEGEEPKNLHDFVDEQAVDGLRDALMTSISELQQAQESFRGDIAHFDKDLHELSQLLDASFVAVPPNNKSPIDSTTNPEQGTILDLLSSMINQSHSMAEHLTSLNRHFDLCVTAVRITEGGAALAKRKAAEDSGEGGPVSISGVIREQQDTYGDDGDDEAQHNNPAAKTEILQIVMRDATEVDDVVADLAAEMQQIEVDYSLLKDKADAVKAAYDAVTQAFGMLKEVGAQRLAGYVASEAEFVARWESEKQLIFARLEDMENLRDFYEGYTNAYDSLVLEVERRRAVEDKIHGIWQKAKDQVDKLIEADWRDRETFRSEVGEYIPQDLWTGMSGRLRTWKVVCAEESDSKGKALASEEEPRQEEGSAAVLGKEVVEAAKERALQGGGR